MRIFETVKSLVKGENPDHSKAFSLLQENIEKNDNTKPLTYKKLGKMYELGIGVKPSYKKAKSMYERAIECGYLSAYSNVASLYKNGRGVKKNERIAKEKYKLAPNHLKVIISTKKKKKLDSLTLKTLKGKL